MNLEISSREALVRREELKGAFRTLEIDFDTLSPLLQERLERSFATQKTLDDDFVCAGIAEYVEEAVDVHNGLSHEEWRIVRQASVFSDIGKTGPADATKEQSELISRLYAIDTNIPGGPSKMRLHEFFAYDPALDINLERHIETLREMGIDPNMTMRDFFNIHAKWSNEILAQDSAVSPEVRITAVLHHILEGVNPDDLVAFEGEQYRIPLLERPLGGRELWTTILDKYQAALRRGRKTHEQAIEWLRMFAEKWVALKPFPENLKQQFLTYVDQLDQSMQMNPDFIEDVRGAEAAEAA